MHTVARRRLWPPWGEMREWLEYAAVWVILKALGALPRSVARGLAVAAGRAMYAVLPKLRRTAECCGTSDGWRRSLRGYRATRRRTSTKL